MTTWAADTMRELNKRVSSPTVAQMAEPARASSLLSAQDEVIHDLRTVTEQFETLAAQLCGGFPVAGENDKPHAEGIVNALHHGMTVERELISRLHNCINMIRSAI